MDPALEARRSPGCSLDPGFVRSQGPIPEVLRRPTTEVTQRVRDEQSLAVCATPAIAARPTPKP